MLKYKGTHHFSGGYDRICGSSDHQIDILGILVWQALDLVFDFQFLQSTYGLILQVDTKSSGTTALQVASHQGHIDIVKLLLAAGSNLELQDEDGDTALHYSAFGSV